MNKFVKFCKDKAKLNLTIDIILFFLLMAMAGLGFLIKYTLLSGEKRNAIYGNNVNLELLGMDRHQWGTVHLIVSIVFVIFIVLHIIFHWKMIVAFFKILIPNQIIRMLFSIFISVVGLFLFVFGFVVNPEQVQHDNLYRNRTVSTSNASLQTNMDDFTFTEDKAFTTIKNKDVRKTPEDHSKQGEKQHKNHIYIEEYEVLGSQSISYVSDKYGVPGIYICNELGIPTHYQSEKLGRLRKKYNFSMPDVSRAIVKYKNNKNQ